LRNVDALMPSVRTDKLFIVVDGKIVTTRQMEHKVPYGIVG
jgi:hypothetical protein